jgi:uncharacterized protein
MRKILLILAALAAVVLAAAWQTYTVKLASTEINALAVGPTGGAVLPIKVTLLTPGDGRAYVAGVPEAGEGFGPSAQIALYVAARYSGRPYTNYTALAEGVWPATPRSEAPQPAATSRWRCSPL